MLRVLILALLLCGCVSTPTTRHGAPPDRLVGLWVTRWDYRTSDDVTRAIREAAEFGITDVFWQVRGQADAFYRSELEPWGAELLEDLPEGTSDPGFDPLALAVREAHRRGMRLHAWINVFPLWKGTAPPTDPGHPWLAHPEWRLYNRAGDHQPLNDHYVIANPASEAVHAHIESVARDIAARYRIDGLHLDYVRFVSDTMDPDDFYPADPETLALFSASSGIERVESEAEIAAYRGWIRSRISTLVQRIRDAVREERPDAVLTGAVWRRPELARERYLQDAAEWVRRGTLDYAVPMIYHEDDTRFADDVAAWRAAIGRERLVPGLGIYKHAPGASATQLAMSGDRYVMFAYAALFDSATTDQDESREAVLERKARRRAIRDAIAR